MEDLHVILGLVLIVGVVLGVIFFRKKQHNDDISVSTCGTTQHPGGTTLASVWHIGPRLTASQGGNKSPGMPPHPTQTSNGFYFDVPTNNGEKVDYVTFNHGPLTGKSQIRMKYTIDAPNSMLYAVPEIDFNARYGAQMTMYFQRERDNWTGRDEYETYRWFATFMPTKYLSHGEHEIVVPLNGNWTAVSSSTAIGNPSAFKEAIDNSCCVGFVFGGNEISYGHGMRATAPARFTVTEFTVE